MKLHRNQPWRRTSRILRAVLSGIMLLQLSVACREPATPPFQVQTKQAQTTQVTVTVFSATLRQALAERAQTLTAARTALQLGDGTTANSCDSYLKARKAGTQIAETVDAQLVASEYLICEALDLLPADAGSADGAPDTLGDRLAKQLDLRTFPSSLGPQLDADRYTLAALSNTTKTDAVAATLEDESSTIRFEVVAEADLNGDAKQDWIVWMTDESRDGNYRGYATLVVDAAAASTPLKAKAYPATG